MNKKERIEKFKGKEKVVFEQLEGSPIDYLQGIQYLIDTGKIWGCNKMLVELAVEYMSKGICVDTEEPLTNEQLEIWNEILIEWENRLKHQFWLQQTYKTVLLDPPWNEKGGGRIKRGADRHYDTMKTTDILSTILTSTYWSRVHANAHMYMWVTNNFLEDGLFLVKALGFRYVTNFVWVKDKVGLGQYFRGQHELCLFATRGKKPTEFRTESKSISSVLHAERTKHSQKPTSSYDLIEKRSLGPYLELFARSERENWASWGNEVPNFDKL